MRARTAVAVLVVLLAGLAGCSTTPNGPLPVMSVAPGDAVGVTDPATNPAAPPGTLAAADAGREQDPPAEETPGAAATSLPTRFDDTELTGREPGLVALEVVAGVEVAPGVYRTVGTQVDDGIDGGLLFDRSCTFGQYRDADGGLEDLIAGGTADGGRPTVTLSEGQLFRTARCGAWELVPGAELFDDPGSAPTTVSDGMWLVGEDLRPGTYRTRAQFTGEYAEEGFCGFEVDSGWTDWDAEILVLEFPGPGHGEVTLATGQQFVSSDCGTWDLVTPDAVAAGG